MNIHSCGNDHLWFRSYSGSLGKAERRPAPSNQGVLPLTFGASLRSCSVGPPPSAIHGRRRLTRHPCRVAHCAEPALGLTMGRAPQQQPRRPTGRPVCRVRSSGRYLVTGRPPSRASPLPQGRGTSARFRSDGRSLSRAGSHRVEVHPPDSGLLAGRYREQARSYSWAGDIRKELVGWQAAIAPTESRGRSAYTPAPHHSSGRALARLQLLILIYPPHRQAEWRCSSGDWRAAPFDAVELIACRCQRSQPEGDAPG